MRKINNWPVRVSIEAKVRTRVLKRETYCLTLNLKSLIRIALNDPQALLEIQQAVEEGAMPHTAQLGAANLKDENGSIDAWFSLYVGTAQSVQPGDKGFLLRNQEGDRISMRLKRQTNKNHATASANVDMPNAMGLFAILQAALNHNTVQVPTEEAPAQNIMLDADVNADIISSFTEFEAAYNALPLGVVAEPSTDYATKMEEGSNDTATSPAE